jgi:4-hydroxy-tetrahydrodipicolinate reductase
LVLGRSQITEIETHQGIKLIGEEVSKIYRPGESDQNKWQILGVPNTYLENKNVATDLQTCTSIVNRIPDVINCEPGYITIDMLPMLKFRAYPLHYYLKL